MSMTLLVYYFSRTLKIWRGKKVHSNKLATYSFCECLISKLHKWKKKKHDDQLYPVSVETVEELDYQYMYIN